MHECLIIYGVTAPAAAPFIVMRGVIRGIAFDLDICQITYYI